MNFEKSTGWKIPLIFCVIIIFIVACIYPIVKHKEYIPVLPQPLLERAKNTRLTLDGEDGKKWKNAIIEAASGFVSPEVKDGKLLHLIKLALASDNLEAASMTVIHISQLSAKESALNDIFEKAINECATLHWGIISIKGNNNPEKIRSYEIRLAEKWKECGQ